MHSYLQIFAAVCYSVLAVCTLLFGADRGIQMKKLNTTVIHFFVCFMALWYYLELMGDFVVRQVDRDDGVFDVPLLHFITSTTIMITFTVLVSYRIKRDTLNVLSYAFASCFVNISLILSVLLFHGSARRGWTVAAIVATGILIIRTIRDSEQKDIGNQKFVKTVIVLVSSYIVAYLCVSLMGPLHQNIMSFSTQETILTSAGMAVSLLCALPLAHYGWAISHKITPITSPGDTRRMVRRFLRKSKVVMSESNYLSGRITDESKHFIDQLHSF